MSISAFVYAPMSKVHGKKPVQYVVESLEELFETAPNKAQVLERLKELGREAQEQFPGLQ